MTTQIKRFIELGDIIALRIDCRHCGASISLLVSRAIELERVRACPSCGRPWLNLPTGSNIEPVVKGCIAAIKETVDTLRSWEQQMRAAGFEGFALALEIKTAPAKSMGTDQEDTLAPASRQPGE